jgi:hypothetical protein
MARWWRNTPTNQQNVIRRRRSRASRIPQPFDGFVHRHRSPDEPVVRTSAPAPPVALRQFPERRRHGHGCFLARGVPGFPDFPDAWQGETSRERLRKSNDEVMKNVSKNHAKRWKIYRARHKRQQRRVGKATNPAGASVGKEIKKRQRDQRRVRRREKAMQLQQRRARKRGMGDVCRGLASMKCK